MALDSILDEVKEINETKNHYQKDSEDDKLPLYVPLIEKEITDRVAEVFKDDLELMTEIAKEITVTRDVKADYEALDAIAGKQKIKVNELIKELTNKNDIKESKDVFAMMEYCESYLNNIYTPREHISKQIMNQKRAMDNYYQKFQQALSQSDTPVLENILRLKEDIKKTTIDIISINRKRFEIPKVSKKSVDFSKVISKLEEGVLLKDAISDSEFSDINALLSFKGEGSANFFHELAINGSPKALILALLPDNYLNETISGSASYNFNSKLLFAKNSDNKSMVDIIIETGNFDMLEILRDASTYLKGANIKHNDKEVYTRGIGQNMLDSLWITELNQLKNIKDKNLSIPLMHSLNRLSPDANIFTENLNSAMEMARIMSKNNDNSVSSLQNLTFNKILMQRDESKVQLELDRIAKFYPNVDVSPYFGNEEIETSGKSR